MGYDYFTSDLHIGHDKPFLYEKRGYANIEDHDTAIIKIWNDIITPDDTVYILGDLCMSSNEYEWNRVYKVLNGHKKFVHGNHDTDNKILRYINEYNMEDLGYGYIYKVSKKRKFLLTHYPTMVANHEENKFFYNLSGHTHSTDMYENIQHCVFNVAWDAHHQPVSVEQIIKYIEKYREHFYKGE